MNKLDSLLIGIPADLARQIREEVEQIARAVIEACAKWQPIETAPRDNKAMLFLASFVDGKLQSFDYDGIWDSETDGWENGNNISYFWASAMGLVEEPTHWMYQPVWFDSLPLSDLVAALPKAEPVDATDDAYLQGTCTENECVLCRTPRYARLKGMHHSGIPYPKAAPVAQPATWISALIKDWKLTDRLIDSAWAAMQLEKAVAAPVAQPDDYSKVPMGPVGVTYPAQPDAEEVRDLLERLRLYTYPGPHVRHDLSGLRAEIDALLAKLGGSRE